MKESKIYRLEEFKIKKKELVKENPNLTIHVNFEYSVIELKKFKPRKRPKKQKEWLSKCYHKINSKFENCEPLGGENIYGAKVYIKYHELKKVEKLEYVESIFVTEIEGIEKKKLEKEKKYITLAAQVRIDVEGIKKKKMRYELLFMTLKANSIKKAKKLLKKDFKQNSKPYLNPYGRIVRWSLEKVLDGYETIIAKPDDINDKCGVEVYSKIFKNKKEIEKITQLLYK